MSALVRILCLAAVLSFFLPLVVVKAPVRADVGVSGYDIVAANREDLAAVARHAGVQARAAASRYAPRLAPGSGEAAVDSAATAEVAARRPDPRDLLELPSDTWKALRVRFAELLPPTVALAYALALLALLVSLAWPRGARFLAAPGALLALAALLQVRALDSVAGPVLRRALHGAPHAHTGTLSRFGRSLLGGAAGAAGARPGAGLYVLAVALGVVVLLAQVAPAGGRGAGTRKLARPDAP